MDFDKKHTGDLLMAYAPQQVRESVATLYHDHFRQMQPDAPLAMPEQYGYEVKTSPASSDKHVHTAHFDAYGNGHTSRDSDHSHSVRAFLIAPFMDPMGIYFHEHPGMLEKPDADPKVPK